MKLVGLLLGVFGSVSIAMVGLVHLRKHDLTDEEKANHFEEIKLRVTEEVLEEYQKEAIRVHRLLDKTKPTVFELEAELTTLRNLQMVKKAKLEECEGKKKSFTDQVAAAELDQQRMSSVIDEQQKDLTSQLQSLKDSLEQKSKLCDFIKKDSAKARMLCKEDLKVDAPKEEPKVDTPKEEPKVDVPKEEPKVDAPKEEPKVDAPKEEPKVDAPKEEPKVDAPKEEPKVDAPKEEPKVDAPKEEPKVDTSKEEPKQAKLTKQT